MGVWGPKGYKFIKEVGKLISDKTKERRSTVKLQAVDCPRIFRLFMKGKFDTYLCTVTFGSKSPKLNSRPVYCSRIYGTLFLSQTIITAKAFSII